MPALAAPAEETRLAGRAAGGLPELASFRAAFPGYEDTSSLDALRASEYGYLDAEGQIYLDYTGAGLPAQAQLSAHAARLHGRCFGNPHSESPTSAASTALIERTRRSVLDHFSASEDEYAVIFAPNASAGSTDRYMEAIGVPGGAIRASVGLASTIEDVQTFLALLHNAYYDRSRHTDLTSASRASVR